MRDGTSKLKVKAKAPRKKAPAKKRVVHDPRADLLACLRAGVHREFGYRRKNAAAFLGRTPAAFVVEALQAAGSVWWTREERRIEERNRPPELTLAERLGRCVVRRFVPEIQRRGGETAIHGRYGTTFLGVSHKASGLYLLKAEGWRQYSRRFGARRAGLAYLCGRDDNGDFAARVPATCETVQDALDHLTPAEVRKALADGRQVLRQGDVWLVERKPKQKDDVRALPKSHVWDEARRLLRHQPADGRAHGSLHIPFYFKAVPQSTLQMGRDSIARWGHAD